MKLNTDSNPSMASSNNSRQSLDFKKPEKRIVLTDEDPQQAPSKKAVPLAPKANKGLKRNLKNWEAFMEDEDDAMEEAEDTDAFHADTALNLEINVLMNPQHQFVKAEQNKKA
jgi:hypothetical protein